VQLELFFVDQLKDLHFFFYEFKLDQNLSKVAPSFFYVQFLEYSTSSRIYQEIFQQIEWAHNLVVVRQHQFYDELEEDF
jgi:Cdc6-like AAA superfamily ATPase